MKRAVAAALAGLALLVPASAAAPPASWTIADRGPRGGTTYAGTPVDGVGALYVPAGVRPGRRLRVAYLLGATGDEASLARRLGVAAAGDQLSWQRTTPPFAVVVTSARGRRTLAAAMQFAQRALPLSRIAAGRAVIGVGSDAQAALRAALQPGLGLGTGVAIGGRIPGGLARAVAQAVRARRVRIYRPAIPAGASASPLSRHQLLEGLAFAFAPAAAGRSSRAAVAIAPYGWVRIASGPYGGTVWQGVIPNRADPGHPRASLVYLPPQVRPQARYPGVYLCTACAARPTASWAACGSPQSPTR